MRHRSIGPFRCWIGRSDGEHPVRWVGVWIPLIGEIELFLTSARVHRQPQRDGGIRVDVRVLPASITVSERTWDSLVDLPWSRPA